MSLKKLLLGLLLTALSMTCGILIGYKLLYPAQHSSHILGRVESAQVGKQKISLQVRMDTGAQTSSLNAQNIKIYQKQGKDYVHFTLKTGKIPKTYTFDLPLERYIKIRKRRAEINENQLKDASAYFERRPVVKIPVCLGEQTHEIEVSLADRSQFHYPMLLGRTAMETFSVLIDPKLSFTTRPHCQLNFKEN